MAGYIEVYRMLILFADHYVQNHVVCVLHSHRTDSSKVPYGLFDVFLNDAVML